MIVLHQTESKNYVSTVYIASNMFKIMYILLIKVVCIKINHRFNELRENVIESPYENIAIHIAILINYRDTFDTKITPNSQP